MQKIRYDSELAGGCMVDCGWYQWPGAPMLPIADTHAAQQGTHLCESGGECTAKNDVTPPYRVLL